MLAEGLDLSGGHIFNHSMGALCAVKGGFVNDTIFIPQETTSIALQRTVSHGWDKPSRFF